MGSRRRRRRTYPLLEKRHLEGMLGEYWEN